VVFGFGYEAEIGFEAYCGFAYGVAVVVVEDDEFGSGEGVLCVAVAVAEWDGGVLSGGAAILAGSKIPVLEYPGILLKS
jgi:hypothetical protein